MNEVVEEKLKLLPTEPGIYRYISREGKIIYVGKAKNLKNRVRSYFLDSNREDPRTANLLPNIYDVEWVVTNTETEALILEDQLIKSHRPRYNVQLKDDKTYPYFKLSIGEMFPRLTLVREIVKDGSLYFGPYVSVREVRSTWQTIKRYFPLRQSAMTLDGTKTFRPCLNYQLKRCLAPCTGQVAVDSYQQMVDGVLQLLKGNYDTLLNQLQERMAKEAEALKFEEAAKTRDQIKAVQRTFKKQKKVSLKKVDRDVFGLVRSGGFAGVEVLFIRNGLLLSEDFFFFKEGELYNDYEILRSTLSKLYIAGDKPLPDEILIPFPDEELAMLEEYCHSQRQKKLQIIAPQRGNKKSLVDMAVKNAVQSLQLRMKGDHADDLILKAVRQRLRLRNLPNRVECFDISNISGTNTVASMVVWEGNQAAKKDYRKYKIKSVDGPDDFASMQEVLGRRYRPEKVAEQPLPDLIIIDGGKGQLSSAVKIFEDLGMDLKQVDVVGLAKGRSEIRAGIEKGEEDYEYIVKPNQKNIIPLRKNSVTLFFLQNIRDEAHRFAITFHRQLRSKGVTHSQLEDIPGIGPQKRKNLLKHFQNLSSLKTASLSNLEKVKGISLSNAQEIYKFFHQSLP
ncbi:MAG: excinuclease ABC subunit C [SAR324 cluster bacterium]|uniref:UvrABC system protein C n=1 Tax=SAR324 cluster bacterium TaxID=2024889 RepID=A0A2A4SU48_9DELT|nr:MAG: excinuclease ABC subunit C [SAR324 cluster bacterium]